MKKFITVFVLVSALLLLIEHFYLSAAKGTEIGELQEQEEADIFQEDQDNIIKNNILIAEQVETMQVVDDKPTRPIFNLTYCDLPDEILDYIYQKGEVENDISYTLLIAMAMTESSCKVDAKSHTNDSGLFQINRHNIKWLSELAGINNVDKFDPYHNADMAIAYLVYLRDKYSVDEIPEEDLFFYMVMGYHYGETKLPKYIKKYGLNSKYVDTVLENKILLEANIVEEGV